MPRPEKVQAVADIKEKLESAQAVFLAEYAGLSVKEQQDMRRALRATEGQFKVVKMTLARLAAEELGYDDLAELLSGPTGLTFADHDAAATAKALRDFARDHAQLIIKGALLSGEVIPPEKVSELADLPSRDALLAQIAGAFQAPMATMAGLLAAMPRDLATMVQQLIDKLPDEPAPGEEAAAEEAPPEEAEADDGAEADDAEAVEEPAPAEEADADDGAEVDEAPAEEAADEAPAEQAEAASAETDEENDEAVASDEADEAEEDENDG